MTTATSEQWLYRSSPDGGHPPSLLLSPACSEDGDSACISPPSAKDRTGGLATYSPTEFGKKSFQSRGDGDGGDGTVHGCYTTRARRRLHNHNGAVKQAVMGILPTTTGESVGRQDASKVSKKRVFLFSKLHKESVMNFLSSLVSTVVLLMLFLKYQNISTDSDASGWSLIPKRSDINLLRYSSILRRNDEANGGRGAQANEAAGPSYALLYPNPHCQGEPLRIDRASSRERKCDNCRDLCHVKFPEVPEQMANAIGGKISIKVFGDYAAEIYKDCRGTWDYPDTEGWKVVASERPEGECAVAPFEGVAHVQFSPAEGHGEEEGMSGIGYRDYRMRQLHRISVPDS